MSLRKQGKTSTSTAVAIPTLPNGANAYLVTALADEGGGLFVLGVKENKKPPHEIVGTSFVVGKTGAMERGG